MLKVEKQRIELANTFSAVLNEWIHEKLYEVNLRNKEKNYIEGSWCATHDFCDANQAMIDAFKKVFGYEPTGRDQKDNSLIDHAWNIAKHAEFKPYSPTSENVS